MAAWAQELEREQREERREKGEGKGRYRHRKEAVTTKDDNLNPHRQS
jgi:hypothetical protein